MANDFVLSSGNAHEIELSMNRVGGWTPELVHKLCKGDFLTKVRLVLEDKAEIVMKKVEEKIVLALLGLVKNITLGAVAGKNTAGCFTSKSRYYYRDGNLDNWLHENQPYQAESGYSIQQLTRLAPFKEVVESHLGITGDIATLAGALKERKVTTTLPAIEALIERQESGEDVNLRTDGYANFFFVEDKDGGVSVVYVSRVDGQWCVVVYGLGRGYQWNTELRFFFRN
jgi:hypothetical protein